MILKTWALTHHLCLFDTFYDIVPPICASWLILKLSGRSVQVLMWMLGCSPGLPVDRMFLVMVTLSSELRAQSTMPLQPFMGKLMSDAAAGRLWMLKTAAGKEQKYLWSRMLLKNFYRIRSSISDLCTSRNSPVQQQLWDFSDANQPCYANNKSFVSLIVSG